MSGTVWSVLAPGGTKLRDTLSDRRVVFKLEKALAGILSTNSQSALYDIY